MRVSDSYRFVYVHNQKTGGVTMETVLDGAVPDIRGDRPKRHLTLSQILEQEPALNDYWIFGVVRNPWARMVSWWSMIHDGVTRAAQGEKGAVNRIQKYPVWRTVSTYPDFEHFIMKGPAEIPRLGEAQLSRLQTPQRKANYIGRTETLTDDIAAILVHLGLPPSKEVPRKNASSHAGTYRDFYTPMTRDRVAELYAPDIDEFGYDF